MPNKILHKRSDTPDKKPTAGQLEPGELAINTHDGKIFMLNTTNNSVVPINVPPEVDGGIITSTVNTVTRESYGPWFLHDWPKWDWAINYPGSGNELKLTIKSLKVNGFSFVINTNPVNYNNWAISSTNYIINNGGNSVNIGTYYPNSTPGVTNYTDWLNFIFNDELSTFFDEIIPSTHPLPNSIPQYIAPSWSIFNTKIRCTKQNTVFFEIIFEETFIINDGGNSYNPEEESPYRAYAIIASSNNIRDSIGAIGDPNIFVSPFSQNWSIIS